VVRSVTGSMTGNVKALAMIGNKRTFSLNKSTVNEQKAQIMIHSSIELHQPELLHNSELKADKMQVSPSIANAMLPAVFRHKLTGEIGVFIKEYSPTGKCLTMQIKLFDGRIYFAPKHEFFPVPILHLNLKTKWFDLVESGKKKEEYRDIKTFWNRVFSCYIRIKGKNYHPTDVIICFSNGYAKNRRQMFVMCNYVKPGFGKSDWGAEPNKQYHVLSLGNVFPNGR
jgi:hypothetical protein